VAIPAEQREPMEQIATDLTDGILTITLNRPDRLNAWTPTMARELIETFDRADADDDVRVVIITGAGRAFCAGADLERGGETFDWRARGGDGPPRDNGGQFTLRMFECTKPLIAAVNGPAMAGGAGLLLACDLVLAARTATFGLPEPRRGIVAGMVTPLLYFRVGGGHAARLLLSAQTIDAAEAHRIGLFHEVVEADHLWPKSVELAAECARSAPEALQLTKRMLNETVGEHLPTLLSAGAAASATARTTEAAAEGLAAFLEKREPQWK